MKKSNRWLVLAAVLGMLAVNPAQAGSISCGVHIIKDNDRTSATESEVLKKCGKPKSQDGDSWIYKKGGRVTEVRFVDGKVRSIR